MQPDLAPNVRPGVRFLLEHPAHLIALGFGSGLSPVAPGTVGTLWGWLAFVVAQRWLSLPQLAFVTLAALPVGWWAWIAKVFPQDAEAGGGLFVAVV